MDPAQITAVKIGVMKEVYSKGQARGEKLRFKDFKTDSALKLTPEGLTFTVYTDSGTSVPNCTFYTLMWFVNFASAEELDNVTKKVADAANR
jgi:hypothetical protein